MKKFIPSPKVPRKSSLHVSQKRGPYGNRRPLPEPYLAYLSGSPVKEFPPPISPHRAPSETDAPFLEPSFIHLSTSPVYEPPSRFPAGPLWKDMPVSRAFSTYFSGSPVMRSPSRFPAQSGHRERCCVSRALLQISLGVPGERTPPAPRSSGATMERGARLQSLLLHISPG